MTRPSEQTPSPSVAERQHWMSVLARSWPPVAAGSAMYVVATVAMRNWPHCWTP